jgi:hypothetical protein
MKDALIGDVMERAIPQRCLAVPPRSRIPRLRSKRRSVGSALRKAGVRRLPRQTRRQECAFAVAPGNFLDSHNATAATIDAPHRVQKEDEKAP